MIAEETEEINSNISRPISIPDLLAAREAIIDSWRKIIRAKGEIEEARGMIWDPAFRFDPQSTLSTRYDWDDSYPFILDKQIEVLDYSLWVFALEKLNITKAMTEMARDEFLKSVQEKKIPFAEKEITGLVQNAGSMFRDSSLNTVREVYKRLIGIGYQGGNWGSGKKDNLRKVEKVFRVGWSDLKVDMGWRGNCYITNNYLSHNSQSAFRFEDLLTACRLIEGRGMSDYSNNLYQMVHRIQPEDRGQEVQTEYFHLHGYKNGNIKVRWNEDKMHVLDKLNAIGSGKSSDLPDTMRKKHKAEHFHNGGVPEAEEFFRVDPDMKPSDEKDFAFYPTPTEVAKRMVELAEYEDPNHLVTLEPSAGNGAIIQALDEVMPTQNWGYALEFNHHRFIKLYEEYPGWVVAQADFLQWEGVKVDRVLMNPPYNDRIEAYHVVKAFGHLKPGGILVAIIPDGWFTRDDLKSTVFRAWMQKHEHKPAETLPAGTFSRTRIITRIITLRRPE